MFIDDLEEGTPIPEPEREPDSLFSGKFVVRIPSTLHRQLVDRARKENVSLNYLVGHLLSYNTPLSAVENRVEEFFAQFEARQYDLVVWPQYPYEGTQYKVRGTLVTRAR